MNRREFGTTLAAQAVVTGRPARVRINDPAGRPLAKELLNRFHVCDLKLGAMLCSGVG